MKTFPFLAHVLVRSFFSPYHNQIGMILSGGCHWQAVVFGTKISIFHPDEIHVLPRYVKDGFYSDTFVTLCAWCPDRNTQAEKLLVKSGRTISHGICPDCRETWNKQQTNQKETSCTI